MKYVISEFSKTDVNVVRWQLKTGSVNIAGIVERCRFGYPSVIILNPLGDITKKKKKNAKLDYISISTPVWLTCPFLNERIHSLESMGYIDKITDFISSDKELTLSMKDAHAEFYFLRKSIYRYYFNDENFMKDHDKLFGTGIGGTRDIENVKCLHMHYAHYRVCDNNYVGKISYKLLDGIINCKEETCSNAPKK